MHWDQMTATPAQLRKHATRFRRAASQLEVLESIINATDGPWLGALDTDGRTAAELKMHLAGHYRLTAVVTSAGKLTLVQMHTPTPEHCTELVLSTKPALRRGWDTSRQMPKQAEWLDYVIGWVRNASQTLDRRAILQWRLQGADPRLAAMTDTIEGLRAILLEREQDRDALAAEVAELRAELESLDSQQRPATVPAG
ncbi:hypothetical protein [Nocardia sp. NBC_00403]|uniref:hypothetical protein n=1 Tax=Nocardia sp. NBC_00403 TaxID=2975990 RepID=UPI002E1A1CF5